MGGTDEILKSSNLWWVGWGEGMVVCGEVGDDGDGEVVPLRRPNLTLALDH